MPGLISLLIMASLIPTYLCRRMVALDSLDYNFTLSAVNVTKPNANLTGAPLVLGQAGKCYFENLYTIVEYSLLIA